MTAFEQKTRIVPSREIWGCSQNKFLWLQPKKKAEQRSRTYFWNLLNEFLEYLCFVFSEIVHLFSESLYENHRNNCIQYKTTKTTFPKKSKAVFKGIRFRKTSETQDVKSQRTKRSLRSLAKPKRDSAFEQKTRIVPSREIWGSFQNSLFSYNRCNKPTRAQKDDFGTYSNSFWKISVLLKKQELFFLSIRYHKTSQTQDVKSQSTEPSLRKLAQPKRDCIWTKNTYFSK